MVEAPTQFRLKTPIVSFRRGNQEPPESRRRMPIKLLTPNEEMNLERLTKRISTTNGPQHQAEIARMNQQLDIAVNNRILSRPRAENVLRQSNGVAKNTLDPSKH